jgi:HEAT repeat protein
MSLPKAAPSKPLTDQDGQYPAASGSSLPPVEAPTGTFILQLFLIPLLIVAIVVMVWLLFSWMANLGQDNPKSLVEALARGDDSSWQRAYQLADLLRSPDPKYDALRRDSALAKQLAVMLAQDLKVPAEGDSARVRIMRRMFICRALGSFEVTDGLPVLIEAAKTERDPIEAEVRLAAIEGITTLADRNGPESFQENPQLIQQLLAASREPDGTGPAPSTTRDGQPTTFRPQAEIRAVAAYALGVIGGDEALARLKIMLRADAYPNARYNAATGLARHGDPACLIGLKEMLDPDNERAASDENNDRDKDRKRATVLMNGIRATLIYADASPDADLTELKAALQQLADDPLTSIQTDRSRIQSSAQEALRLIESKAAPRT